MGKNFLEGRQLVLTGAASGVKQDDHINRSSAIPSTLIMAAAAVVLPAKSVLCGAVTMFQNMSDFQSLTEE